jgi:hypothetical protein
VIVGGDDEGAMTGLVKPLLAQRRFLPPGPMNELRGDDEMGVEGGY